MGESDIPELLEVSHLPDVGGGYLVVTGWFLIFRRGGDFVGWNATSIYDISQTFDGVVEKGGNLAWPAEKSYTEIPDLIPGNDASRKALPFLNIIISKILLVGSTEEVPHAELEGILKLVAARTHKQTVKRHPSISILPNGCIERHCVQR